MTLTDTQTPTQAYLTELRTSGRASSTLANKRSALKRFDAWLAGREVTKELLHAYAQHVNASEGAPGAKREHIQVVRTFMYWSRMHGFHMISRDDIRDMTPKCKAAMRVEPTVLSRPAIEALYIRMMLALAREPAVAFAHMDRRVAAMKVARREAQAARAILACLFTGCRAEEAQGITVNADLGTITIIDKKRNQTRTMPTSLFAGLPDVFDAPRRWSRAHWKQWCKEAGPLLDGVRVKDLRSTWRNYAVSSGMEAQDCAGMQGHTRQVDESSYALRQRMPGVTGDTVAQWFNLGSQGG